MSQRDVKLTLNPYQSDFVVRAPGDFVFLRAASGGAVRVAIDGQPTKMEPGEKRRIQKPFSLQGQDEPAFTEFYISNLTGATNAVELVVGDGDYEKIIVSGELNISAYVKTANGVNAALPTPVTKTFGIDSFEQIDTVARQIIAETPAGADPNASGQCFMFDGRYYALDSGYLYEIDIANPTVWKDQRPLGKTKLATTFDHTEKVGAVAVTPGGTVYFTVLRGVYWFSMADCVVRQISWPGYLGRNNDLIANGGGYLNGRIYINDWTDLSGAGEYIIRWHDLNTGEFGELPAGTEKIIGIFDGKLIMWDSIYDTVVDVYDETLNLLGTTSIPSPPTYGGGNSKGIWDFNAGIGVFTYDANWVVYSLVTRTEYGRIYVQNGADTTTRKYITLTEPVEYAARLSAVAVTGKIIKYILLGLLDEVPENYLDYIVGIEYSDGFNRREINSGTESWSLRGIPDYLTIFSESEFTITLLPEIFDQ